MITSINKLPVWFWILSVLALIWNGLGVIAYLGKAFATDEMIAALPVEQQAEFITEYPAWYTAAFALAVFCGTLGCLSLLIRKKWAFPLFIISAFGAIVQHTYLFMNVEMTPVQLVMPIMVISVCIILVWFAKNSATKGWLK
ncbi:hypothetical protein [Winogradskyella sp. UBA3174]|uniref:hypothetical protein n=1 Tax=Winogradskyella sp. UBA3174 TaxID=1947785 RepID=UPI0025F2B00C|nr:hypothetical protein [Winogradskyella sp. UBA3174]|tara:strand:- start:852 stop:1277 length:426 start_codon:yes stop_codon:yes gene_type:complete